MPTLLPQFLTAAPSTSATSSQSTTSQFHHITTGKRFIDPKASPSRILLVVASLTRSLRKGTSFTIDDDCFISFSFIPYNFLALSCRTIVC
ncbi:hypothetical protein L6452_28628 [Arctium lappa]|uniref:Uncharacterized protein n=1 Tax=Arctium lappa TaxID=4217 RepID=A0ACB8ZYZ6_ARCLA|nr:hypothetical protein L6452_28628 [Arctium lappa]